MSSPVPNPSPEGGSVDPAPKPMRRTFTAEYRNKIIDEYDQAPHGQKSAVLRQRGTRRAVAGTTSRLNPEAGLGAVGSRRRGHASLIVDAHHAAIADVVAFMEREVAATRAGATAGDGAVAQVDVGG